MADGVDPIPAGYPRINPALVVRGGAAAIEFYREVFEARVRMNIPGPGGVVAHAELEIGDSVLMVEDELEFRGTVAPPAGGFEGSPIYLVIYVEDVDAVVARAVERGADLRRAPEDQQMIGMRDAYLIDPFGHGWTVATRIAEVDFSRFAG